MPIDFQLLAKADQEKAASRDLLNAARYARGKGNHKAATNLTQEATRRLKKSNDMRTKAMYS